MNRVPAILITLVSCAAIVATAANLDVIEVKQPAVCAAPPGTQPMPCAFIGALLQKMRGMCGDGCAIGCGETVCPVKL